MIFEHMNVTFKTPKKLRDSIPKRYEDVIELTITFPEDSEAIGYFFKDCLEDGFRENGVSVLVDFTPRLAIKTIEV